MKIVILLISLLMVIGSIIVLFQKSIKKAALIMGMVSLLAALFFVMMKAYDVAITEASIGAILTTALFFITIKRLEEDGYRENKNK